MQRNRAALLVLVANEKALASREPNSSGDFYQTCGTVYFQSAAAMSTTGFLIKDFRVSTHTRWPGLRHHIDDEDVVKARSRGPFALAA